MINKPLIDIDVLSKTLIADNTYLTADQKYTYLSADAAAAATTLTVDSIIGFAVDLILLIGEFGTENSEIVKTHASTAPTGSTVTLASALSFDHNQGDKVTIINFDQMEFSQASTATGTKTVLETIAIQADQLNTISRDTTWTTGTRFGFVRLKDTIGTTYSPYSDPVDYTGYASNSVRYIINYALNERNKSGFTDNVTHDFCIEEINSCLAKIKGKRKHWINLQEFDYSLGSLTRGEWRIALPTNMYQYSNKSILAVHYAGEANLEYRDEREWNNELEDTFYTDCPSGATAGDTTLTLTDSTDFKSSGTVMVAGMKITYTGNSANVLSGIPASGTGSITSNISADAMCWQGDYQEGVPEIYTIKEGYIYCYPLVDSTYTGKNLYADYWKEASSVDSDYDTIDVARFDMVKYYLTASVRWQLKNDGIPDKTDGDYQEFLIRLNQAATTAARSSGQKYKMTPKLNKISY